MVELVFGQAVGRGLFAQLQGSASGPAVLQTISCNWERFQCSCALTVHASTVQRFNGSTIQRFNDSTIHFISSMICFISAGISGNGSRRTCIEPSGPLRTTMLNWPAAPSLFG